LILAASELMTPPIQMVTHLNPPLLHQLLCDTSYVSDMQIIPYIVLKKKLERDPDEKNHTISERSKEARGERMDGTKRSKRGRYLAVEGLVHGAGKARRSTTVFLTTVFPIFSSQPMTSHDIVEGNRRFLRTEASRTKPCGCRAGHGGGHQPHQIWRWAVGLRP
jgi:hypothetical protein